MNILYIDHCVELNHFYYWGEGIYQALKKTK